MKDINKFLNALDESKIYYQFSKIKLEIIICITTFLVGCSNTTAPKDQPNDYKATVSNAINTPYCQPTNTKLPAIEVKQQEGDCEKFTVEDISEYTHFVGLKNKHGDIIIEPKYSSINYIGNGLYAVIEKSNGGMLLCCPMAIFNNEGKQLTEFCYYQVGKFQGKYASASDDTTTFFIDTSGKIVSSLPRLKGIGEMTFNVDGIKADIDGDVMYLTKDGKVISSEDNTITINDNIKVRKMKYRPDYATYVVYPEFINLPNKNIESKINSTIKKLFIKGNETSHKENGLYRITKNFSEFTIKTNKNIVSITQKGIIYGIGAVHPHPERRFFNIDLTTGKVFVLSDMFKNKKLYLDSLSNIIANNNKIYNLQYMDLIKMYISDEFTLDEEYLKIVFKPYSGLLSGNTYAIFSIPYSLVIDQIDTKSELWKAFDKKIDNNINEVLIEYDGLKG